MMVVLIVESVPPSLRGELSKWMIEPKAGVFVGTVSAIVRDLLWKKACAEVGWGGCTMIYSAANEQGFAIRSYGDTTRQVEEFDGLFLVRRLSERETKPPLAMYLWAKQEPFHSLPCHMVDVGHVAMELLRTAPFATVLSRLAQAADCPPDTLLNWIGYLVALHDWGKGWRTFQAGGSDSILKPLREAGLNVEIDEQQRHIRHEVISRLWIEEHLESWAGWDRRSIRTAGSAIAMHHGRVGQDLPTLLEFPTAHKWFELRGEVEELVRSAFHPKPWSARFKEHSVVGMLLSGLIVWADWVASNEELFPLRWRGEPWDLYQVYSRAAARGAVAQLGLTDINPWRKPKSFTDVWKQFDPRPVQQACEELIAAGAEPGLLIVEAPMGEGKSEAALYVASQWIRGGGGMYVAMPTAATSNQMFERVRAFAREHDPKAEAGVQLVHGTSWLVDRTTTEKDPEVSDDDVRRDGTAADWFKPKKRSLLATYGVGTIDQALMAVLHVKHSFLRMFGLAGKVLVVDEVHAYDPYMNEILTLLLRWLHSLGTPVILLSATLPATRRRALISAYLGQEVEDAPGAHHYPLLTYVSPGGEVRAIPVERGDRRLDVQILRHPSLLGDPSAVAGLIAERVADGGCLCVIANTVDSAQRIYDAFKAHDPETPTLLFHSRFRAMDRRRIEDQALAWFDKRSLLRETDPERTVRPKKAVLIATQVVEQSLDLDFDEMITEIAPIDLLLQRVGRLHRHKRPGRERPAVLHVLLPSEGDFDYGASGRVYAPYVLFRTHLSLPDVFTLPTDIRPLVEKVYSSVSGDAPADLDPILERMREEWENRQRSDAKKAEQYLIPEPSERAFKLDRNARRLYEADEESAQTYFTAKTRLGDQTMSALLIERGEVATLLDSPRAPSREDLQELLLHSASIPRWWLRDVEPDEGYEPVLQAPRWLSTEVVLFLIEGEWRGRDTKTGRAVRIVVDGEYGVRRLETEA